MTLIYSQENADLFSQCDDSQIHVLHKYPASKDG